MFMRKHMHIRVHLKSGQTIKFRAKEAHYKFDSSGFTSTRIKGFYGDHGIPIDNIAAVEIKQPMWIRIIEFIIG